MTDLLSPSRPVARTLSLQRSLVHAVMPRKNTCIAIMVKNNPNYNVKSARQHSKVTIVIENLSRPNTSVLTAKVLYSVGKDICTSLPTNAATITAPIESTLSKNSTRQNGHCLKQNLPNLNYATFTANTYSRPKNLNIHHPLSRWSILQKSTTLKMSLA